MNMALCQNSQSSLQAVIMLFSLWQAKIEASLDYYCQSVSENVTGFHYLSLLLYFEHTVLLLSVYPHQEWLFLKVGNSVGIAACLDELFLQYSKFACS